MSWLFFAKSSIFDVLLYLREQKHNLNFNKYRESVKNSEKLELENVRPKCHMTVFYDTGEMSLNFKISLVADEEELEIVKPTNFFIPPIPLLPTISLLPLVSATEQNGYVEPLILKANKSTIS